MLMGDVFPRNPDGTLKHAEPCQTPGCNWPCWHICLDTSDPEHTRVRAPGKAPRRMTDAHRMAIAEAQRERHARAREAARGRDNRIIELYTTKNLSMAEVAKQLGCAQSTVNKVLNRAQREGVLKIRPKNVTISRPGK